MAIFKDDRFRNKYILQDDSTNAEFQEIIDGKNIRCIICNSNTAKRLRTPLLWQGNITINNRMMDNVFFINGVF